MWTFIVSWIVVSVVVAALWMWAATRQRQRTLTRWNRERGE